MRTVPPVAARMAQSRAQIDDQPVGRCGVAGEAMAAASGRHRDPVRRRQFEAALDIVDRVAPRDRGGSVQVVERVVAEPSR